MCMCILPPLKAPFCPDRLVPIHSGEGEYLKLKLKQEAPPGAGSKMAGHLGATCGLTECLVAEIIEDSQPPTACTPLRSWCKRGGKSLGSTYKVGPLRTAPSASGAGRLLLCSGLVAAKSGVPQQRAAGLSSPCLQGMLSWLTACMTTGHRQGCPGGNEATLQPCQPV